MSSIDVQALRCQQTSPAGWTWIFSLDRVTARAHPNSRKAIQGPGSKSRALSGKRTPGGGQSKPGLTRASSYRAEGLEIEDHAVIAHFDHAADNLDALFDVEAQLEAAINEAGVGEFDGNEIAVDLSDCPGG